MLLRIIVISIPVFIAFGASTTAFVKERTLIALVQLIGAICLVVVILAHIMEAFDLFPSMGWGHPKTIGHYIDLASVITGVTLLLIGYLLRHLSQRNTK